MRILPDWENRFRINGFESNVLAALAAFHKLEVYRTEGEIRFIRTPDLNNYERQLRPKLNGHVHLQNSRNLLNISALILSVNWVFSTTLATSAFQPRADNSKGRLFAFIPFPLMTTIQQVVNPCSDFE